ncbi:MAG: ABC transporter substrate-binding protein [Erysipelotrichaceae bacterium]|nr:ABC transporter substrate-binding protein [Erysipelotrichaceae bacterium]
MKKLITILLAFSLLALAACSKPASSETPASETAVPEVPAEKTTVRLGLLKGPTGIGASVLLGQDEKGETVNDYEVTLLANAQDMVAEVASGSVDIAAMPTNVASALYNKTSGGVKVIALNTGCVLYVLENGDTVHSFEDLKGKTIMSTGAGANPEFLLNYLLKANGIDPRQDLTVTFFDSNTISTQMVNGTDRLCLLPVPAVTAVMLKNENTRIALDLNEEWEKTGAEGMPTMGCVVVRSEFAAEHPEAVDAFLTEYEASIEAVKADPAAAGELCAKYEITPSAPVAVKAIPDSSLIFVSGEEIRTQLEPYYQVLFDADPTSIGGKLPGDDFYSYK